MNLRCITADEICYSPPNWAVLQRKLLNELESAADIYLAKYARDDGTLIFTDKWPHGRDGLDDLYEAFYNLPLLYLLGGDERFLTAAHYHWEAVNRQAADYGLVLDEYELGYDQFHQSEGNQFFYLLCAADPENPVLIERARRFANHYLSMPNYDPDLNIIRAFHTGSGGPRWGYLEDDREIWTRFMEPFGLPFDDLPGINTFDDLGIWHDDDRHVENRQVMNDTMNTRMGQGDSVANLLATSLVTNAFIMTGDPDFKNWVETYTKGWWVRAEENGGFIPDNVGLDGKVGSEFDGNWFGAAYGWTWPLGYDSINDAISVAAMNATLLSGNMDWMELPGNLFDVIFEKGALVEDFNASKPPRPEPWIAEAVEVTAEPAAFTAPKKYKADGWFAPCPFQVGPLASRWCTTFKSEDKKRLSDLRDAEPQDWQISYEFRSKGDDGHERSWLEYLSGRLDEYPEIILQQSRNVVEARLDKVRQDNSDLNEVHIHHWQQHNPVTTEALVQLTLGGPQQRYNGGFFRTCFRYFDAHNERPGLPPNVSALVSKIDSNFADLTLINLGKDDEQKVTVQGGFYREHQILEVRNLETEINTEIDHPEFAVKLPPQSEITLRVTLKRFANRPQNNLSGGKARNCEDD